MMESTSRILGKREADFEHDTQTHQSTFDGSLSANREDSHAGHEAALPEDTEERWPSVDGVSGHSSRLGHRPPVSAVFVHAGAGYHSVTNEIVHLKACNEAARAGMRLLQAGQSALDAAEAAIKVLEDKEIANAGYGSNLSIDGTVECDATIVDHMGRSGAAGAVSNIKNPIALARLILEKSRQPLSLRRVPPNLLVGDGAKDFAAEHGMPLVPNAWLVSRNAQDRFLKWEQDLKRAETRVGIIPSSAASQAAVTPDLEEAKHNSQSLTIRDHKKAIQTGVWNEGQPDSPAPSPSRASPHTSTQSLPALSPGQSMANRNPLHLLGSRAKSSSPRDQLRGVAKAGSQGVDGVCDRRARREDAWHTCQQENTLASSMDVVGASEDLGLIRTQDYITDTVGAIAIDNFGNIAAASSSGGIGMKHRGRVGPAALVGVGTSVIPQDEDDEDGVSVAAVTSGTGEHMATTMASQKCAERLYQWTRRGADGSDVPAEDESEILESFITSDFQRHPGVRNSTSAGAIGVMAVKRSTHGFYLYFAHNTDSFALASMASTDREPKCVMSRLAKNGCGVSQGARKIHST